MISPSRSRPSTSFTSSSRCVSVLSVRTPRACSWRSSQRSIQLPTRLPAIAMSVGDQPDRRERERCRRSPRPSRGPAEPASAGWPSGSRRCRRRRARCPRRPRSSAPARRPRRRPARRAPRRRRAPERAACAARRCRSATTVPAPSTFTSWSAMCPTPPTPITAVVVPGTSRWTSPLTAWYAVIPASECGATSTGSTPAGSGISDRSSTST